MKRKAFENETKNERGSREETLDRFEGDCWREFEQLKNRLIQENLNQSQNQI